MVPAGAKTLPDPQSNQLGHLERQHLNDLGCWDGDVVMRRRRLHEGQIAGAAVGRAAMLLAAVARLLGVLTPAAVCVSTATRAAACGVHSINGAAVSRQDRMHTTAAQLHRQREQQGQQSMGKRMAQDCEVWQGISDASTQRAAQPSTFSLSAPSGAGSAHPRRLPRIPITSDPMVRTLARNPLELARTGWVAVLGISLACLHVHAQSSPPPPMAGGSARSLLRDAQPLPDEPEEGGEEEAPTTSVPGSTPVDPSNAGQHPTGADAVNLLAEVQAPEAAKQWKGFVGLSGAGKSATGSSNLFLRAELGLEYTHELDTLRFSGNYYFAVSDAIVSDNRAYAGLEWNRDFKEESPWFYFALAQWELDQLLSWDQRVGAYAGAGYQLVEQPDWRLTAKLAPGAERVFGDVEEWFPNLLMRLESVWKLDEIWSAHANVEYLPDLSNWDGNYTVFGEVKLRGKMSFLQGAGLEVGMSEEYNVFDRDGATSDFRYYAGVRFEF